MIMVIVSKPDPKDDPAKRLGLEAHILTRVNSRILKKIFEFLISHMKKLINNNICCK